MRLKAVKAFASALSSTRNLAGGEAWNTAKESVVETYDGVKYTVKKNMIMSIIIVSVILLLLILCCYLKCKYSRPAQAMTKRQHDALLRQREERTAMNEENRKKNRRRKNKKQKYVESPNNLASSSYETKATVSSDARGGSRDIENDGIEIELNSDKSRDDSVNPMEGEYLVNESPQKKPLFGRFNKESKVEV